MITLETEIEDQINWSIHTPLIFRNSNKNDTEKTSKDAESTLAREILRMIPGFEENAVYFNKGLVHRHFSNKTTMRCVWKVAGLGMLYELWTKEGLANCVIIKHDIMGVVTVISTFCNFYIFLQVFV